MAQADFTSRVVALAALVRLPRVDAGDQRVAKTVGVAQGITHGCDRAVGSRPLLALWRAQNRVPRIEVRTEPPERTGEDAGHLGIHAFGVHPGGEIRLHADGEGRQLQRFRIEVIEQAQVQIP